MDAAVRPRSGIPVSVSRTSQRPVVHNREDDQSPAKRQNDTDLCTETVSVKTAVHMFGGEARIRKLPTPDRSLSRNRDTSTSQSTKKSRENDAKEKIVETNIDEDISLDFTHSNEIMDYPIRGTISPLTDNSSYGKATLNGLLSNDISFVFGRPSLPVNDLEIERCRSPPSNDSHPMSPDALPSRRRGMHGKPPIYVPPHSRGAEKPYSGISEKMLARKMNALGEISYSAGIHCEHCNNCLIDLKRQTLRLMYPDGAYGGSIIKTPNAVEKIEGKLQVPSQCQKLLKNDRCDVCDTHVNQLKKEAVVAVLSIQQTQTESPLSSHVQFNSGLSNIRPPQHRGITNGNNHVRQTRPNKSPVTNPSQITTQALVHVDPSSRAWNGQKRHNQMISQQRSNHGPYENRPFSPEMSGVGPYSMQQQVGGVPPQAYNMQYGSDMYNMHPSTAYMQSGSGFINMPQGTNPYMLQSGSGNIPAVSGTYVPQSGSGVMPHGSVQYVPQSGLGPNYYSQQNPRTQYIVSGSNYNPSQYANYSVPPPTHSPPPPPPMSPPAFSRVSSPGSTSSQQSAAASFFARAAQKLGKKKKRHHQQEPELPQFPTKFHIVIRTAPPPAPPCLLRTAGRLGQPGVGKVKVMLKICSLSSHGEQSQSCLSIDPRKKQVTVFDPSSIGIPTSAHRKTTPTAPKMFAFDAVFSPDDSQTEICASSLTEVIQGVVNGADGCLFTYGYSKLGKSYTMVGKDASTQTLGIMPCAIAWLFRLINEQKEKTGARFSVRVSAVEVCGKSEHLRDLLADVALGTESGIGTAPGVYLRDDPICGTQLENQSELRAPSADRAAYYLDAAIAARSQDEEEGRSSHLLFTLHVYQYRIEKANQAGLPGVAGGRSRLHLIDLGSSSKSKDPENVSLSLSALGNVIMALLNGQRHVPHRDSKVAQLLRDSLGNISCRTCMLAHVSSAVAHHNETLQVIQLAARIHRMRRRKTKFSSTSSDDSSTDDGRLRRPFRGFRMGTLREDMLYSSSHSDPDYTSSSEQSCDTVIYVGANGQSLSDREVTDNEGPPRSVPRTNPRLPRRPSGSRSSGDEGSNSDSGRSRASSDFRYGRAALVNRGSFNVNRSLSPKVQQSVRDVSVVSSHAQSPPMSPSAAAAHLPRKVHVRTRPSVSKSEEPQHPLEKIQRSGMKGHMEQSVIKGEQWIDGPGATAFPDKKTVVEEHWIDGPQAFVVKQEQHASKTDALNKHLFNPKMNAEEQWVDGPREMIAGSPAHKEGKSGHNKPSVHSSCRNEKRNYSQEPKVSPSHSVKHKSKHSQEVKDLKERPDSTVSVDSATSVTAQGPDSRPVSVHVEGEKVCKVEEGSQIINPFVRDWVEKHSSVTEEGKSNSNVGFNIVDCENQVQGTLESASKYKRSKPESRRKLSASTPKHSPHHSPRNSPSVARKGKCEGSGTLKLQKSHLPMPANPTHRVTEWLKSVSVEQQKGSRKDSCDPSVPLDGAKCSSVNVNSSSQDISSCSSIQMDTTMEMDSQCDTTINTAQCSSDGRPDEMAECNIGDISFDSSVDTSEFNTMLSSNRESIYEIQMDEQLEKTVDCKSADIPDNDTFSSASCNKDNDDLSDGECNFDFQEDEPLMSKDSRVPHSLTVESLKTLVAEPVEQNTSLKDQEQKSVTQNQSCKLCEKDSTVSENEKLLSHDIKSSLLRKPDGASNPNLINELNFEGKFDVNLIRGEYVINNVHSVSSHSNLDLNSYKNSTSVLENLPKYSDSTDNNDGKLSSPKSKPPLPSRPSSKSHSASPSRQSSSKIKDKDLSLSPKSNSSYSSKVSSASPSPSHTSRTKDKNRIPSTSSLSSQRSSSLPVTGSPSSTCTTRSTSSKSSKTQSPISSRLPVFSSKTLQSAKDSKLRKKDKEVKLGNGRVGELNRTSSRGTDSDSGNDSGIVTNEKKLLSPYCTITKPRTPSHSSSGHGSDNSSTVSADLRSQLGIKSDKIHGGTSSGYESMLRDSEGSATSSGQEECNSESSSEKKKGSKRKRSSTKRSRSAPARSSESPDRKSPSSNKATSPSPKAWVDTRQIQKIKEEPFEIKLYDMDDVERLGRRRGDDEGVTSDLDQRKEKIKEMLTKQGRQPELIESKDQIVMENRNWGFDCKFLMCFCRSKQKKTDV